MLPQSKFPSRLCRQLTTSPHCFQATTGVSPSPFLMVTKFYVLTYDWLIYVYLGCTVWFFLRCTWWFDLPYVVKWFSQELTHLSPHLVICVCVVRTLKIYSQQISEVQWGVITMPYISSVELTHLIAESLFPLMNVSPFLLPLALGNHCSTLGLYEFNSFGFSVTFCRFHKWNFFLCLFSHSVMWKLFEVHPWLLRVSVGSSFLLTVFHWIDKSAYPFTCCNFNFYFS